MATEVKLTFPDGSTVFVQAFSNAALTQTVTIQPPAGGGDAAVFQGSGESNVPQALTTQGFLTANSGGQPSFVSTGGEYMISIATEEGDSQVMGAASQLNTPAGGTILVGWVSSEDQDDEDWNDSVVLFTTYLPPTAARAERAR